MRIVQHHEKYLELHGEDKVVSMSWSEHQALHRRLRREGKCNIPYRLLDKISHKAHDRSEKGHNRKKIYAKQVIQSLSFCETMGVNSELLEFIRFNRNTGSVNYVSCFRAKNGLKFYKEVI